jgi:hypothetical protein
MQQRPEGLAGARIENHCGGVWSRRLRLEHGEATPMERMNGVAYGLVGTVQLMGNWSGRLALGTGKKNLAAPDGKGGRGPQTGLQSGPLVRRERAYK